MCFVRLPFGLSPASEIFCKSMDHSLEGILGTFPCADDMKVQGSTEERHDIHLLETVEKASKAGVKFNPKKCQIKKQKIEYFGRIVTPQGVEASPKKVNDLLKLAPPTDKTELHSFLSSVNYLSSFIPNLSKKTHLLRGLMKKNIQFIWTSDMEAEFDKLKQAIASATQLIHYDPNKPVILETDASKKGLGAVLIQDERPVRFLSKALTSAEQEYSNIERELLAVLHTCEKLHTYTFGRTVTVHTDHQPLETIFKKPISLTSPRLQRMLLRLTTYNLEVKYVSAKNVLMADTLSRLIVPGKDKAVPGLDITIAQVMKIRPTCLSTLQEETKSDKDLTQLSEFISSGWPESIQDVPQNLQAFWCFKDELGIVDGLVLKGSRVVIPQQEHADTLQRLHEGHQGLQGTLR